MKDHKAPPSWPRSSLFSLFRRPGTLHVAILYFVIIAIVMYWHPGDLGAKDVLSLITPIIFYLLGIHSSRK